MAAILGMAGATYLTRAGGVWLMGLWQPSPRLEAALRQMPGAVLAAIVAPAVIQAGIAGVPAVAATVLVARRTGNLLLALLAGVATIWVLRHGL
jgi:uncharacterized membrane protein